MYLFGSIYFLKVQFCFLRFNFHCPPHSLPAYQSGGPGKFPLTAAKTKCNITRRKNPIYSTVCFLPPFFDTTASSDKHRLPGMQKSTSVQKSVYSPPDIHVYPEYGRTKAT